jgi:hypothetical protein
MVHGHGLIDSFVDIQEVMSLIHITVSEVPDGTGAPTTNAIA